jgi:hypothetical protein
LEKESLPPCPRPRLAGASSRKEALTWRQERGGWRGGHEQEERTQRSHWTGLESILW